MSDQEAVDARSVTITFANGGQRSFAFEPKIDPSTLGSAIQKIVEQGYINLEMDDRFIMVPLSSVQTIQIAPKPGGNLPNSFRILDEFNSNFG